MATVAMTPVIWTQRKSAAQAADPRISQLDTLQRLSEEQRDKFLGADWYRQAHDLYNLVFNQGMRPSFRPEVNIPQLQVLMINEATDIAALRPKVYIYKGKGEKRDRDKERERAFQDHWTRSQFNLQLMYAQLWSHFVGTTYCQVGFDPWMSRGKGSVWLKHRNAKTTYPDPNSTSHYNWNYVQWEDRVYIDEVKARFGAAASRLTLRPASPGSGYANAQLVGEAGFGFSLPPGPLSAGPRWMVRQPQKTDALVTLRTTIVKDYSLIETKETEVEKTLESLAATSTKKVSPRIQPRYPYGRKFVDCEGIVLFDAENPTPACFEDRCETGLTAPVVPFHALPNLTGPWCPPPPRLSLDLQALAGRMYTQAFENAVRLNNGCIYIDEATGLTADQVGGIPGQVLVINSQSKPPTTVWPNPIPQHFITMPDALLAKQKELWGVTPPRQGETGKGNVSFDLFDAAVYQAEPMKRLRAQLSAYSIQDVAELVYRMMCAYIQEPTEFIRERYFPSWKDKEPEFSTWQPLEPKEAEQSELYVDQFSLKPISQMAFQKFVMGMRQGGMIDNRHALEWLEVPDAEEIAEAVENEQKLMALAKVRRR